MTKRIAVCGKGGVGKTTIVCGITKYLLDKNKIPILVIDADPNSNLGETLGISSYQTIADVREELRNASIPQGFSKTDYINLRLQEVLVENKGFDFIAMGRPEGRECYCFVNELLRTFMTNLTKHYEYVLIDTEAGMEHFSRRTTDDIDLLIIVSSPSRVAFTTVKKILDLTSKLKLKIKDKKILLNLVDNDNLVISSNSFEINALIHKDKKILFYSEQNDKLIDKIDKTDFYSELNSFLDKINLDI